MRLRLYHHIGRTGLALRLSLALLFGLATVLALGQKGAGAATPSATTAGSSSLLSVSAPLGLNVEIPGLVKVETSPSTSVEVAGLPKVELPALPKVEVPLPKAETPSPPPVETTTTPTATTPTPAPTSPSGPPAGPPASGNGASGNGAGAASAATSSSASAPAAKAGSGTTAIAPTNEGRSRSPSSHRRPSRRSTGPAGGVSSGQPVATSAAGLLPLAGTSARAQSSSPRARTNIASASNPLEAIGRHIPFPVPVPDWSKPIILLLLLVALGLGVRSRVASLRAKRLEGQRAVLMEDLDVMQAALVPVIPGRLGDLAVSVAYRPADGPAAGGDFYDLFVLDSGKVAIILGDVAGHGHSAITQAALTRYTLRAYIQAGLEPRAAIALAGSVLADAAAAHYATVVVALYDGSTGRLTYSSAGHPPPVSIASPAPEPLTFCCSPPVGWDVPTGRRQTTLSLPAGSRICFFSDGLLEARVEGGLLGRERLLDMLAELGPSATATDLLVRVRSDTNATPDDMVACILEPAAEPAAVPAAEAHVEEIEVDGEDLDRDDVRQFLAACHLSRTKLTTAIARARKLAGASATALLRIEQPLHGEATVDVVPGFGTPPPVPIDGAPADEKSLLRALASAG